jgi:hypothetical protein
MILKNSRQPRDYGGLKKVRQEGAKVESGMARSQKIQL